MATALLLLAPGFEEIEAVTIADVLRRAGVKVTIAGIVEGPIRGSHDIALGVDARLEDVKAGAFDAVVLPGGMPGAKHLRESPRVLDLVRAFERDGKLVAAICAAPTVLEAAGVLRDKRATSYPGFDLPSAKQSDERVVEDGKLVTSRGPGTAMDFALALVRRLVGADAEREHRKSLLASA